MKSRKSKAIIHELKPAHKVHLGLVSRNEGKLQFIVVLVQCIIGWKCVIECVDLL